MHVDIIYDAHVCFNYRPPIFALKSAVNICTVTLLKNTTHCSMQKKLDCLEQISKRLFSIILISPLLPPPRESVNLTISH